MNTVRIPIFLLKTKSLPNDNYEDYFSRQDSLFEPTFIPVLEHQPNLENLKKIKDPLRRRELHQRYGGMIFTSQRAVEAFANLVHELEAERSHTCVTPKTIFPTSFPLYTVGQATSRTLTELISSASATSFLSPLHPTVLGAHTGTGASLASFILTHYNHLHYRDEYFGRYEAPRLPFVPLIGEPTVPRDTTLPIAAKKPLLFLVGEQRRDIIPRVLAGSGDDTEALAARGPRARIGVDELEVYGTTVQSGFEVSFSRAVSACRDEGVPFAVVVVFSPSMCEVILRTLGVRGAAEKESDAQEVQEKQRHSTRFLIVTIGPTTHDHMARTLGFAADACAEAPTPQGVGDAATAALAESRLRLQN